MTTESTSELELERFKIYMGIPLQAENKLVFNLKKFQTGLAVFYHRGDLVLYSSRFSQAANFPN